MRPPSSKRSQEEQTTNTSTPPTKVAHVVELDPTPAPPPKIAMSQSEYDSHLASRLQKDNILVSDVPVKQTIGKSQMGLMCPRPPYATGHDAIPLLQGYAGNGCPVDCGQDWTQEHVVLMLKRGPHRSANCKKAVRQLRQETEEKIKNKYARVVRWGDIKENMPKKLKISPVAMIPHKSKPFRCILDLSFTL